MFNRYLLFKKKFFILVALGLPCRAWAFLWLGRAEAPLVTVSGLLSSYSEWASPWAGFSFRGAGSLGHTGFNTGFSSCSPQALERGLNSRGSQA